MSTKISIEMDPGVAKVAEFIMLNIEPNERRRVVEALQILAPALWRKDGSDSTKMPLTLERWLVGDHD